ncbi:MAG: peptidoglycan DD-metalloendopeptidase family protein [Pseudomonadota bacterium]|nr:peptidoglycan DD-metalloendopeptidase family protein [Pseudomonadota bacterium]
MNEARRQAAGLLCAVCVGFLLTACASTFNRAPVEVRHAPSKPTTSVPPSAEPQVEASATPAVVDNAGKPGYYTVKPSDTLLKIALDNGQNWKDLARWNGIENPNVIEIGQVLRVIPPGADPAALGTRPAMASKVEARPSDPRTPPGSASAPASVPVAVTAAGSASVAAAAASAAAATGSSAAPVAAPAAATASQGDDAVVWMWPATGAVTTMFDDVKSKGLAISGKAGDPVLAAADGRVVYAGSGLRGYGNLVIVKHNSTYLTAYAHNQSLLVKEDQAVRRGQKIAEMGSTDAERVQLHFEIRKQGKPIDPAKLLPAR